MVSNISRTVFPVRNTKAILVCIRVFVLLVLCGSVAPCKQISAALSGTVVDPQSKPVGDLRILLIAPGGNQSAATTDKGGRFSFGVTQPGSYTLKISAPNFLEVSRSVQVGAAGLESVEIRLGALTTRQESITVTADVKDSNILFPDPAQRVYVRQELLDANPGRPGAPLSIPGLPIETASGGIKAPQYFSPGVAGDHGEPIAEYIQVGSYLLSNNLSSNAHGNGYADPNILVASALAGVQTDGGAFNVREGNHAENLSAIYQLRTRLEPFVTVTGDYRDVDAVAGWSPEDPSKKSWVAVEAAYGNGFLQRLEHRRQYKVNGFREFDFGNHQLTIFGLAYYGFSFIPGLVPQNVPGLHDTIDSRQRDQTHTGEIAANDVWKPSPQSELQLSGFFRTYNLALSSNFGDGLIRQSEFRTVSGGNGTYVHNLSKWISLLAGVDYQRDAPRRLDLDHYTSADGAQYGPFEQITANNVTLHDTSFYVAFDGSLSHNFHYNVGWRRDEIGFDSVDLLTPTNTFSSTFGFNSPKATFSFLPKDHPTWPTIAFSFGEAFYTNDPRIGFGTAQGTPISREHSYQLVVSKRLAATDFRVTLGHVTTEASLAKIDPDTGLQQDRGPGRNLFVTFGAKHYFGFGTVQASVSKADARDLSSGLPTPEAPRLIIDILGTVNRLPFGLQARAEYEQVGAKPLGDGFTSLPVKEFRGAVVKSLLGGRVDLGLNFLVAGGYTGQTTEVLAAPGQGDPFEQAVGIRLPSYVSVSCSYRFGRTLPH